MDDLDKLRDELTGAARAAESLSALDALRVSALGKKGRVTELAKGLGTLGPEARRERGQAVNALKAAVTEAIEARRNDLAEAELDARLAAESVDVTLPARPEADGRIQPIKIGRASCRESWCQ